MISGLETAIFIGGVGAQNWRAMPLAGFVGVILGLIAGFLIVYSGRKVENLSWFFYCSSVFLFFVAAGFINYAASELESIYIEVAQEEGSVIIGVPLWDLTWW